MGKESIDQLDQRDYIVIKGARVNNLKNVDLAISRNKLTVITGVSGSGKSSLAYDTLYAEGQRMYVESLSSYARQFLGRMEKPDVDYIKGVSPAIAIEQKVTTKNPRSTVGTTTEIYDYLKLLFSRVGVTYSPVSGKKVKKHTVGDVTEYIKSIGEGTRFVILSPLLKKDDRSLGEELEILLQKGYTRVFKDNEVFFIEELLRDKIKGTWEDYYVVIDRSAVKDEESFVFRTNDSVQTAFYEGDGDCYIFIPGQDLVHFSDRFELDGVTFEIPTVNFFSFNNPFGACKHCEGFGHVLGIDPDLVVPDKSKSIFEGAIAPWKTEKMSVWQEPLIKNGIRFDFPIHRPFEDLDQEHIDLLWSGNEYFEGLDAFFKSIEAQTHKIQYRVMLSRYRGRTVCPKCQGTRLREDAGFVKVGGKSLQEIVLMSVDKVIEFFDQLKLTEFDGKVAHRIMAEIQNRLGYLHKVGLGYLTLNRLSNSLSGGEFQRIKLATSLGSALVGSMYVLDEPSIGLHPRDTEKLIDVINSLRDLGNTVVVVEHEEDIIKAADQVVDIGPDAGSHGGELIFHGTQAELKKDKVSYTGRYLTGDLEIEIPKHRRKWTEYISITGVHENNLKNIDVKLPLGILTVITGVSGSGKSTLVKKVFFPALQKRLGEYSDARGKYGNLEGSLDFINSIEFVDQNPIGKSSRSNPVTYVKAYDAIRALYADQEEAKRRTYKPSQFSFNVDGGRCETCQGEGTVRIEMQFMPDIVLTCETCKGKRFKQETLDIKYNDKDISEVLDLTIDDAIEFFKDARKVADKLIPLQKVGLGYITLGQSSSSLSGGEAQRVKLASFLGKGQKEGRTLFIFDEPTTGLHFHDINKLMTSLNALVVNGHSVLVIEHNLEVIKSADWVIDLGPEGGDLGGEIVAEGTPEEIVKMKKGHTAFHLAEKLNN